MLRLSLAIGLGALLTTHLAAAAEHSDSIDLSIQHQVIDNFGASDCWTMQKLGGWSPASRERLADLLFSTEKGIGLSLWRFNIGGGVQHESISNPWRTVETFEIAEGQYDWSRQSAERWFARAAKQRGVPYLLAFVNSPPGRMTRSGLTNSGSDRASSTNLKSGFEKQYARYLCDILQHFRDDAEPSERIPFDYISPVNEPQVEWAAGRQEGNRASNDDIKRMLLALDEELKARKLPVKIRAPESSSLPDLWRANRGASSRYGAAFGNYLDDFCNDPPVAAAMDHVICYHDYSSASGQRMIADHQLLAQKMSAHPNWKLWMSEVCIMSHGRDLSIDMALDVARLIHADLVLSNASAWHWWLAVSNVDYKDGLLYTDWRQSGDEESIIISKTFWAMGNFSRFVRPGMRRIELEGDAHRFDGVLGSAYHDAASGKLVIVYINASNEPQTIRCAIGTTPTDKSATRPAGRYIPYITSATDDLAARPAVSLAAGAELPPRSIVTFVSAE